MREFLIAFVILTIFVTKVSAAILINEISPSTDPEWIELYNDGSSSIDLAGYLLEDGNTSHTDDLILSGNIPSHGYLIFSRSEGWLNNGGDTLKLYNNATPSAMIIDQYTYGDINKPEKVIARSPDGSENWVITTTSSQNTSNPAPSPSQIPSPSVSPSPSPSPSPSQTPTPTPIPSSSKPPTPKPSIKPSPSPSLPTQALDEDGEGTVAGVSTEIDLSNFGISPPPEPSPSSQVSQGLSINKERTKTVVMIGSGLILLSLAGFLGYRKYLKYT